MLFDNIFPLLAETGLLDGKSATLHWGYTQMFSRRYPRVQLQSDKMILDQERLYCSAGANAGLDIYCNQSLNQARIRGLRSG